MPIRAAHATCSRSPTSYEEILELARRCRRRRPIADRRLRRSSSRSRPALLRDGRQAPLGSAMRGNRCAAPVGQLKAPRRKAWIDDVALGARCLRTDARARWHERRLRPLSTPALRQVLGSIGRPACSWLATCPGSSRSSWSPRLPPSASGGPLRSRTAMPPSLGEMADRGVAATSAAPRGGRGVPAPPPVEPKRGRGHVLQYLGLARRRLLKPDAVVTRRPRSRARATSPTQSM